MKKQSKLNTYYRMAKIWNNCLVWLNDKKMYVLLSIETAERLQDENIEIIYQPTK